MIRLDGMTKQYEIGHTRTVVFDDVTIDLPSNRRLAILGGKYSGKTTLINLLAGLESPTSGSIERFVRMSPPVGAAKGLKSHYSVRQNVHFAARIFGADGRQTLDFIRRVMGPGLILDEPLRALPIDMRMSFNYALGYAIPFDTYIFDNTVAYGGPTFRENCLAMFEARSKTAGMIVATSHVRLAQQLCEAALVIEGAKVGYYSDMTAAIARYQTLKTHDDNHAA